uniref:Uncharacterized protein n=1 Tax=Arcella intermedia TaxID=1963864 RepID=A0A6B2LBT3_9EUKA
MPLHISRLAKVGSNYLQGSDFPVRMVFDHVMPSVRTAVGIFHEAFKQQNDQTNEIRITIVLSPDPDLPQPKDLHDCNVFVYAELLPAPPSPPITISIQRGFRKNPLIKDTQWAQERKEISQRRRSDEDEVVLQGLSDGCLFEGLSSNFGVLVNGILYTPPKGTVLEGATLELILLVCEENNIQVIREFPKIDQIHEWQGAFISSTTRCLLPINTIRIPETGLEVQLPIPPVFEHIAQLFKEKMIQNSTDVYSPSSSLL